MAVERVFPNHLAKERAARNLSAAAFAARAAINPELYGHMEAGRILPSADELDRIVAALDGIEPNLLYAYSLVNTIGDRRLKVDTPSYSSFFGTMAEGGRLLVSPDEMRRLDQQARPNRRVEVFINMSCSTQQTPHLMLEIVDIYGALGVKAASAAGRMACCGTYYRRNEDHDLAARMNAASVRRSLAWGASTVTHLCTQCVNTFTEIQQRKVVETGSAEPIRNTQVLRFLVERLDELGDRVPWQRSVQARVLSHGHSTYSWVHDRAKRDVGELARRIPGVEFLGTLDRTSIDSFCDSEPGVPKRPRPRTREETDAYRQELAAVARSWGADTISPSHQGCLYKWAPFSSPDLGVRHVISLLAQALGVGHPDRYQAAAHLGSITAVVEQTRPIWSAWKMSEEQARLAAETWFDPNVGDTGCGCGRGAPGHCADDAPISIDVLMGRFPQPGLPPS